MHAIFQKSSAIDIENCWAGLNLVAKVCILTQEDGRGSAP